MDFGSFFNESIKPTLISSAVLPVVYLPAFIPDFRFMIELKMALRIIDKKDFRDNNGDFAITFLTTDRTKRTGGEFIELRNACRMGLPPNCKDRQMRGIRDMQTGKKYAVHNRLIFGFNGQKVYWV